MLNNTGFSLACQNQGVGNEILLRQRLQDMFIQDWHTRFDLSSRASLYRNLSNMFCYKSYLDSISVVKFRIALTRLRTAAHRLLIETGRWVKPKPIALGNRKCMFKFIELLNNNNELIVRLLALYCFKAFEKRNISLYN